MKKFSYNKILIVLSFLLFLVSIAMLKGSYNSKEIHLNNNQVIVNIVKAPKDCSKITTRGGYCKLEYKGKLYTKRAGNKYCHLVSNKKTVKMLINNDENWLVFLDEYNSTDFFLSYLIMFVSISFIVVGYRKVRKEKSE